MKNLFKYIVLSVAAISAVSLTSCDKYLDKVPDTRVELSTPEQLRLLLVDGYMYENYALIGEMSSDNMVDNQAEEEGYVRYNLPAYDRGDDELFAWEDAVNCTGTDSPAEVWQACYRAVAVANAVLEKVEEFEAAGRGEEVKALKGEALMIRAFHHFILANIFCMPYRGEELSKQLKGIPYPKKPETEVLVHYERGTLAETYKNIEEDLLAGLPLINDGIYEQPKFHFNKQAAYAFAVRFYLYKREYKKVVEYANLAYGGEGVDPSQFLTDIWSQSHLYYLSDYGRYYSGADKARNFLVIPTYSTFWRHYLGKRYTCNRYAKRAVLQGPGPTWDKCRWSSSATKETFAMNPAFFMQCFTGGGQEYGVYFGAALAEQFEYTDKVAGIGYCHEVRAELTGDETLLSRAEAKLFLGDYEGCYNDLKIWDDAHHNTVVNDDRYVYFPPYSEVESGQAEDLIVKFYAYKPGDEMLEEEEHGPGFGIMKKIHVDEVCPSAEYSVRDEKMMAYLQCIQHFRRIESAQNGMRFFDLKRLGIRVKHVIGKGRVEYLTPLDPRRAIQIPAEVISAGFDANDRVVKIPSATGEAERVVYKRAE